MHWTYALLALVAGALLPLQALINARLGHATAGGLFASGVSFLVGTVALAAVLVVMRPTLPSAEAMLRLPPWIWTGGLIGAAFVVVATLAVPRIGAASLIALVVLGQMVAALLLDRYGVLQAAREVNATRLIGAALVVVGVLMVLQPWKAR